MKKALLFIMCVLLFTACTGYNNSTSLTENGFHYNISSNHKEAMVTSYQWNGKEDTAFITIPDTLSDGTPVTSIGGFIGIGVPVSFKIEYEVNWPELPKSTKPMSEEETDAFYRDYIDQHPDELYGHLVKLDTHDEADESIDPSKIIYRDITFTVNIGKNISGTGSQMSEYVICDEINKYGIVQPDDNILVYRPTLYYNVDPENKTFYAKDGILYRTEDGKPVSEDINE